MLEVSIVHAIHQLCGDEEIHYQQDAPIPSIMSGSVLMTIFHTGG
jgi:hypothetical protein